MKNENTIVSSLISKDEVQAAEIDELVERLLAVVFMAYTQKEYHYHMHIVLLQNQGNHR